MAIDPICGMTVDEATAIHAERDGETFYFCCEHCRKKFLAGGGQSANEPSGQLVQLGGRQTHHAEQSASCCHDGDAPTTTRKPGKAYFCPMCEGVESDQPGDCPKCGMSLERATPRRTTRKATYTCPMHPEIEQDEPGTCPKCGMELEPKYPEVEDEDDAELNDMTRRLWIAAALTVPVFLLAMLPMVNVPVDQWLGSTLHQWLQFLFATPVVLWAGWPFFVRGWRSVGNLQSQYVHADRHRHRSRLLL